MSMECEIGRLNQAEWEELSGSPRSLIRLWHGSDVAPPSIGPERRLLLGNRWSALNFLLTGTALEGEFPRCFLVSAGEPLDLDDDDGYGIANLVPPREVLSIRRMFEGLDIPALFRDFEPQRLVDADVYLADLWLGDADASRTELQEALEGLKRFVLATDPARHALLIECS